MVDGIGWLGSVRSAPSPTIAPADAPAATAPVRDATTADRAPAAPAVDTLARSMASTAPIDKDRVAQIRRAIQTGTFPILPATIADRLIALKLEWNGREQA